MPFRLRATSALLIAVSLLASACGRDAPRPTSPASSSGDVAFSIHHGAWDGASGPVSSKHFEFFPLELGNHWRYVKVSQMILLPREGEPTVFGGSLQMDATLDTVVQLGSRSYVGEKVVYTSERPGRFVEYVYLRQDGTGLYEADVRLPVGPDDPGTGAAAATSPFDRLRARAETSIADPARRAALRAACDDLERKRALAASFSRPAEPAFLHSTTAPPELTRLQYPLRAGADWVLRRYPLYTARVEAQETLALAPGRFDAWRIRYGSGYYGPEDIVRVWYGRSGYLGLNSHLEAPWISGADTIGVVINLDTETLTEIQLAGGAIAGR